jgi:hypothetical protein
VYHIRGFVPLQRRRAIIANVKAQVFLGGASGSTTWRKDIAIPILEAAGVSYFDPQLGPGEWTTAHEEIEMRAKAEADVLLFVISGETRGVATVAEVAHYLGLGRRLALTINDISETQLIEGKPLGKSERSDLNRGRIFVRTMAKEQDVPVFEDVEGAARHAVELARARETPFSLERVRGILQEVKFKQAQFTVEAAAGGFLLQICCAEQDVECNVERSFEGRKWFIPADATLSEIVQTAFKAVVTWQEHEARDGFLYQGLRVFGPHYDVDTLASVLRGTRNYRTQEAHQ